MPYPKRGRYTHKAYIYRQINEVFSGSVASSMTIVGYPTEDFQLMLVADKACRIRLAGSLDGTSIIERISFDEAGVAYSTNIFDTLNSIQSDYWETGATLVVTAVNSVGMPLSWSQTSGPFSCEFGQMGGMSAQIEANSLGLGTKLIHYVRIERAAPLSRDMTMSIVGYDDQLYVPVCDFENVSAPPNYTAQEWAFRVVKKQDGDN